MKMADNKISMPSSGGGIMRYFDEYKSKIEIPPTYLVIAIIAISVFIIILHKINPFG